MVSDQKRANERGGEHALVSVWSRGRAGGDVKAQDLLTSLTWFAGVLSTLHHAVAFVEYVCVRCYIWGLCIPGQQHSKWNNCTKTFRSGK